MRCAWSIALIFLAATTVQSPAKIIKFKMESAGNWKYSLNPKNNISIARSEFVLHGDSNVEVGLNLYFSCGRSSAGMFLTPADEKMKIGAAVVTGATSQKFSDWKACSEVEEFECLGVKYMDDVSKIFDSLDAQERLAFDVTVDGRKFSGEVNFNGYDQIKEFIGPNCRH